MFIGIVAALMAASMGAVQADVSYVRPGGDDAASGASPAEAWRTIARVQRALDAAPAGTALDIRFERGGVYDGGLAVRGFAGPRLSVSSYGSGAAPVLSGLVPLEGWESLGGGVWRVSCGACSSMPNVLLRDGSSLPLARWPNADEANRGYLNYESAEGRTEITDEDLPDGIDWTGGEAVLRSAAWILDRLPVIRQRGRTLTFGSQSTYAIPRGYGYFLQNHVAALDRDGEWVFDLDSRGITVFLAGGATPDQFRFEVAVRDTLISVSRSRNVEIVDVVLLGARRAGFEVTDSEDVVIRGVESRNSGDSGMRCINCRGLRLSDSVIDGSMNHGLDVFNCTDCRVERNRILNTATVSGMGRSGNGQYNGVRFGGVNATFAENEVRRSGYLGIDVRGAASIVRNVVSEFNLVKTDGGGIYTWGNRDVEITDNLVRDGDGSRAGVPWSSNATHGIYIDDQSENVRVRGNTVANVASYGVYLHNTRDVEVAGNTVAGGREAQIAFIDDHLGGYTVSETVVRDNVFAATGPGALMARASTSGDAAAFLAGIGEMSGNRYCNPFGEAVFGTSMAGRTRVAASEWQALVGSDADAGFCAQRIPLYSGVEAAGANRVQNGTFDRDLAGWFGWPADSMKASWSNGRLELRHTASAPLLHYDAPAGVVEAGTLFRVRFDAHSDAGPRWMRVYLRKWDPDYRLLCDAADVLLGEEPRRFEFVLAATQSESRSLLIFELPLASQVVWLDNVVLEPVRASVVKPADIVRVEVNPTVEPRVVTLDGEYTGVSGERWAAGSTVLLEPYRSLVLYRAMRN